MFDLRATGIDPHHAARRILGTAGCVCLLAVSPLLGAAAAPLELVVRPAEAELGSLVEIGLVRNPKEAPGPAAPVSAATFLEPGELWHVAQDWKQPVGDTGNPEGWLWMASLQPFGTGTLRLPSVRAKLRRGDGSTETVELEGPVIKVLDGLDGTDTALRDLRDIHAYTLDRRWIAGLGAVALLAACILGFVLRRGLLARRERPAHRGPVLSPTAWAMAEIERRENLPDCRIGKSKVIATEASDVIRKFLQRRFGFAALEMTTHECVRRLEDTFVPVELTGAVRRFLEECDLTKFTRLELCEARKQAIWDDAREIVTLSDRTRPAPAKGEAPIVQAPESME